MCKLYLGKVVDKSTRDVFVAGTRQDVLAEFNECMDYCARDVENTYSLYCVLYDKYWQKCPSMVTFYGMLQMASGYLPVNKAEWDAYVAKSDRMMRQYQSDIEDLLMDAVQAALDFPNPERDAWLKHLDWTGLD